MPRIRVTPEELIRAAQQITEISEQIGQAAGELSRVLNELNPRAYDGQLYSKVAARVSAARVAAQGPIGNAAKRAAELIERGQAFLATDQIACERFEEVGRQGAVLGASVSAFTLVSGGSILENGASIDKVKQEIEQLIYRDYLVFLDKKSRGEIDGECAWWAQIRRKSLDPAHKLKALGSGVGVKAYIERYKSTVQIFDSSNTVTLLKNMKPATALVWGGGTYGHIAIVEKVQDGGVYVSESNYYEDPITKQVISDHDVHVRFIPKDKLDGVYIIPPDVDEDKLYPQS